MFSVPFELVNVVNCGNNKCRNQIKKIILSENLRKYYV
jgi:hypothetical protein